MRQLIDQSFEIICLFAFFVLFFFFDTPICIPLLDEKPKKSIQITFHWDVNFLAPFSTIDYVRSDLRYKIMIMAMRKTDT